MPYDTADFVVPGRSAVGLFDAPSYAVDFGDLISRAFDVLQVRLTDQKVLLKPNFVEFLPGRPINTNPLVVAGAATACLRAGARQVVVGEGPGHRRDVEYLLTATGFMDHLREARLRFVDLNHDDVRKVPLRSRFMGLDELSLPIELLDADVVVSMPKLKSHHWAGLTASMKNLFGVVPGGVYGWPKNLLHFHGISNAILDLVATVRPQLSIVDAVEAMEGDGPIMGRSRQVGCIGVGTDLVAVDATCARLIGLDPRKMEYLDVASRFLGNADPDRIDQRGEAPTRYATRFDVVDHLKPLRLDP